MICRAGEEAVRRTWDIYPVVSARWTGEEDVMLYAEGMTEELYED